MIKLALLAVCISFAYSSIAQTTIKEEIPTGKVNRKVKDHKNPSIPKEKKIRYIYVDNAKGKLIGNPCAIEFTRKMGFEYEIWHRPDNRFHSLWKRLIHNTSVKTRLFFLKGPWWNQRVNKKLKECAIQTGDFSG